MARNVRLVWHGTVRRSPQLSDPESGRIVTANQNVTHQGRAPWLGGDWAAPYRHDRIDAWLAQHSAHSVESFGALQHDHKSRVAELLLPGLLTAVGVPRDPLSRAVVDALRHWNYEMRPDASEPLMFAAWVGELSRLIYEDELGPLFEAEWGQDHPEFLRAVLRDEAGQARWCDDTNTAARETCGPLAQRALVEALDAVKRRYGADPGAWTWGAAHHSVAAHSVFDHVPVLRCLFDVFETRGGDRSTVDVGTYDLNGDEPVFVNRWGPSFRAVYDLANLQRSLFILNTGESGHIMSPHYRDMAPLWARGLYVPLVTDRAGIAHSVLGTRTLRAL